MKQRGSQFAPCCLSQALPTPQVNRVWGERPLCGKSKRLSDGQSEVGLEPRPRAFLGLPAVFLDGEAWLTSYNPISLPRGYKRRGETRSAPCPCLFHRTGGPLPEDPCANRAIMGVGSRLSAAFRQGPLQAGRSHAGRP